jgi:hypothetical protein
MRITRKSVPLLLFTTGCAIAACVTTGKDQSKPDGLGAAPWIVPVDVTAANPPNLTQNDWYNLAWRSFIAINWPAVTPASNNLGQPNTTQLLGAKSGSAFIPTVWLSYRSLTSTMLAGGANPGVWNQPPGAPPGNCAAIPSGAVAPGFQPMVLDMISKASKALDSNDFFINEATGQPLIDQLGRYVFYDIRLNQSEYTYIQQNGYYDAVNQINAFKPPNTGIVDFPRTGQESMFNPPLPTYAQYGALEIKAAWRVLDLSKDILSRYYTQVGYFIQPGGTCEGPVTFGLVGLHILRLTPTTPATWYWATFEQVDNTEITGGPFQRPDGSPLTPAFSLPNTPNGNCTSQADGGGGNEYNVPPAAAAGDIPWTQTNTPVNVCRTTLLDSGVLAANAFWQPLVKNTVWQYYQLINTVNPSVPGGPSYSFPNNTTATVNVDTMANVTMETYSQAGTSTPSCMSCHAYAAPQGAPTPLTSANQIFTFILANADSSDPALKLKKGAPRVVPRFHQKK